MFGVVRSDAAWDEISQYFIKSPHDNVFIVDEEGKLSYEITERYWRSAMCLDINSELKVSNLISYIENKLPGLYKATVEDKDETVIPRISAVLDSLGNFLKSERIERSNVPGIHGTGLIMAGGFGRRLGNLVKTVPKPMLEVAGKPILEHTVNNMVDNGISDIYISIHHLPGVIKDYFQDGSKFGCKIRYLEESKPMGTAGCLALLPKDIKFPIVMINGDVVTELQLLRLIDFHRFLKSDITVATRPHVLTLPYGVIKHNGDRILGIEEKPRYTYSINAAIYALSKSALEYLPESASFDMPTLMDRMLSSGRRLTVFPLSENWIDVGSPATLDRAREVFDPGFRPAL